MYEVGYFDGKPQEVDAKIANPSKTMRKAVKTILEMQRQMLHTNVLLIGHFTGFQ